MDRADRPTLEQLERECRRLLQRQRRRRQLRSVLGTVAVLLALAVLAASCLLPVLIVQGESMVPTLREGQAVVCIRGSHYQKGDMVAFNYGNKILIKRLIAGEGDVLDMDEEGNVFVNGEQLSEEYIRGKAVGNLSMDLPCTVPEDHWFLIGDNRELSVDSRSTVVGFVSSEQTTGRVCFRVWPVWYWEKF